MDLILPIFVFLASVAVFDLKIKDRNLIKIRYTRAKSEGLLAR